MARGRWLPLVPAAVVSLGLLAAAGRAQAPEPTPTPAPVPESKKETSASEAPPKCGDCHTEEVAKFAGNPHARSSRRGEKIDINEFCVTCHTGGAAHMEAGGDKSLIQGFHGLAGAELCANCHNKRTDEHASLALGFHGNTATVNCLSCHSIHNANPKNEHLIAKAPGELCATCHSNQTASFRNKPYAHRLDRGGMTCLDCHNPHDRKGQTVALTRVGELPCLNCHTEKRGPFVFDHVTGSAGDCLSCHQPHGSNNPKMLTWARVDQLCLSCHSQTGSANTLGSQPPSFHDLRSPRFRNCTTCHTAVHGSNLSPQLLK
jgi:DmsE family decaheme c-type cytochrome